MEKAKDKYSDKTITFLSGKMTGRLQADAMDTYNWLKVRDKKIALEFLKKMNFVDKYFEKKEKENVKFGLGKLTYETEDKKKRVPPFLSKWWENRKQVTAKHHRKNTT